MIAAAPTRSAIIAIIAIVCAIAAAAITVPLGQYLFGRAATTPGFAALGSAAIEALFTLVVYGTLLGVAALGITVNAGWERILGERPLAMAPAGLAIGLAGLAAAAAYAAIAGQLRPGAGGAVSLLLGTLVVALQSAAEEAYFRGWLQPLAARAWGPITGVTSIAIVFAGLHIAGGERAPITLLNLLLGGILFGVMALRSGGLALPIAAHFAWNWAEMLGLGLTPNPGLGSFGALVDLDVVGPAIWGGSSEGLNASIGMSFALLALLIPLTVWRSRFSPAASPG